MTKSTITRERAQQIFLGNGPEPSASEERELARMALAAIDQKPALHRYRRKAVEPYGPYPWHYEEFVDYPRPVESIEDEYFYAAPPVVTGVAVDSEPVAWTWHYREKWHVTNDERRAEFVAKDGDVAVLPLYRHAQPAPVVPEEKPIPNTLSMYAVDAVAAIAEVKGWNACRAAMLDRQLVDHVDEESLTSINPAPAMGSLSKTGEVLHTNSPAQGGNSSVIPDTWIPVSEQMPPSRHEVLVGRWWGEKPRWCCKWATYNPGHPDAQSSGWLIPGGSWTPTHWMELPAAPQEVR
ncbi:DUF551 domain-containing protein [Klebsiella quasipneumoniae]|uniref:DUF551 domain-containing protein n=2 Tax=Klebsiella pneumoniae complex TaxID=3390273 RepID=UPI001F07CEE9|nr:DUF551 domain-containing protein [Klebsiella quasipneumoniae]